MTQRTISPFWVVGIGGCSKAGVHIAVAGLGGREGDRAPEVGVRGFGDGLS